MHKHILRKLFPAILVLCLLSLSVFSASANATSFDLLPAPMIFSDIAGGGATVKPLTIKNNTGSSLEITSVTLGTGSSTFSLPTPPTVPFTIPGNGSVTVDVAFSVTTKGVFSRSLTVTTASQSETVQLRGLGASGSGGNNEPSLQWIMDTFALGINVGDDDPSTTTINSVNGGTAPLLGDEVSAQVFKRANTSQPVTLEVLATYANNKSPAVSRNGWYTEDQPDDKNEIFTVLSGSNQTLLPATSGSLSFTPNATDFGIYSIYPDFLGQGDRFVYSQDEYNDWDTPSKRHKIRVYPVPGQANAYVYAVEEFTAGFDYNDVVVLIRNVIPVSSGGGDPEAQIAFENRDWVNFRGYNYPNTKWMDKWLTFSGIKDQYTSNNRGMHREVTLRIRNRSSETPLQISSMSINQPTVFKIKNNENALTIQPGSFYDLVVQLIELNGEKGPRYGTLTINSNDPDDAVSVINLGAAFQLASESPNELTMEDMWATFGFGTYIGHIPGGKYKAAGEEILRKYWKRVDTSKPIYAVQLGAFHGCGGTQTAPFNIRWSDGTTSGMQHGDFFCQSYFPKKGETYADPLTELTATKDLDFYLRIAGNEACADAATCMDMHGIRVWPARDPQGILIPDVYLITQDYVNGGTSANFDYNDNFYLVTNIQPVTPVQANVFAAADGPVTARVGEPVTIRFRALTSLAPSDNVTMTITIPANALYVSHANPACSLNGNVINCNFGSGFINPQIIDVTVKALSVGEVSVVSKVFTSTTQTTTGDDQKTHKFTATTQDPPVANNDGPYNGSSNQTLTVSAANGVLKNDTDANGDALTAVLVSAPANAQSFTLNSDGSFTFTPTVNWSGTTTFTYKANDGAADSNVATATITIASGSQVPVANDDAYTTIEDAVLNVSAETGVLANDVKPEGTTVEAEIVTQPGKGDITLNADGSFTYTPDANVFGTDTFTYKAINGNGHTNATVTLTITSDNDDPVAVDDAYTMDEDTTLNVNAANGVLDNDSDIDSSSLSASIGDISSANGTVNLNADGSFTYTPNANFTGTATFTYIVSDDSTGTDTGTVTITVNNTPDAPIANNDLYGTTVNNPIVADASSGVLANDVDPDPGSSMTVTLVGQPTHGDVTLNPNGGFTYTPDTDYIGPDSFTYTASDGSLTSTPATVNINVNENNTSPIANNDLYETAEGQTLNVDAANGVLANDTDPDNNILTVTVNTDVANGTLNLNSNGSFSYTPDTGFTGTDSFTYILSDGNGGTDTATVTIMVATGAPVATDDSYTMDEDTTLNVNAASGVLANDSDINGDSLTAAIGDTSNANGQVTLNADGSFSYDPNDNFSGEASFSYTVSDGSDTDTGLVFITVNNVNDLPDAVNDSYNAVKNTPMTVSAENGVLANDVDVDGDTLSAVLVALPASGTVTLNGDGSFTYTPNTDFEGTDTFTYRVDDSVTGDSVGTVTIHVNGGATNLIVNGGFEEEDPTVPKMPASWKGKNITSDKIKCNKDKDGDGIADKIIAYEENCAFQFKGLPGENARLQQKTDVAALAEVQDGDSLTLHVVVKGKNVVEGAGKVMVKGKNTNDEKLKITVELTTGTYEYGELSESASVVGTLAKLKVQIRYTGAGGKYVIDAVRLIVNDPNAASKYQFGGYEGDEQPEGEEEGSILLPLPPAVETSEFGRK
jgi:VCBS repeat-containing protein